jgi:transposase InsO family protein
VGYCQEHPGHGYRRLTWMLTDADVAYASPSTVYRILKGHDVLELQERKASRKGKGFKQPTKPHQHWHVDFSYFKIGSVFYYFIAVLDGFSRKILAWDLRTKMEERDAELVIQMAKERFPDANPRIISDQGSQFRSHDFKRFVTEIEATHVMTSPYYPQSNGKLERFHLTLKEYAYRKLPLDLEDGRRIIGEMIDYYNDERLHSAIDYITPNQCLAGQRERIVEQRKSKHREAARRRMDYWSAKGLESTETCAVILRPEEAEVARAEERATEEYSGRATAEAAC